MSGYSMMFGIGAASDAPGAFSLFLDMIVPIFGVIAVVLLAAFKILKKPNSKWITLSVAAAGCYMALSNLISMGQTASQIGARVGVGIILMFIIWLLVAAAAVLDFLEIHIAKLG